MKHEFSLIEAAVTELENNKMPCNVYELFDKVAAKKEMSEEEKGEAITKFYADLTTSAKFLYVGNNEWNLKSNEKIELWEKDGSFYKEYTVVELPEDFKEDPKPAKAPKKAKVVKEQVVKVVEPKPEPEVIVVEEPVKPVVEPVAVVAPKTEGTEEEVFEEYEGFDEEKYNEYMDTYEDQYDD